VARLSEVATRPRHVESDFSSRREVLVLSDRYFRLGESGSPKRGREVVWCILLSNPCSDEVCVFLSEGRTRSGEKGSLERDNVVQPLIHTRLGEVG